jgi:hypothetical protein
METTVFTLDAPTDSQPGHRNPASPSTLNQTKVVRCPGAPGMGIDAASGGA